MRVFTGFALAAALLSSTPLAYADTCYDLVNNRNFDCNTQGQPSGKPSQAAPKTPPADSGLREQLRRSLGSASPYRQTSPEDLGKRIAGAQARMEAALKESTASGARQRYDAALADLKSAYNDAANGVSPALRGGLRDNEKMVEAHYAQLAARADWDGTATPMQPANTAEAPPVVAEAGNVGIGADGHVFVCDGAIDAANVSCREIQADGRQCLAVMAFETQVNWRDSTTMPCSAADLAQRDAFLRAHPEVAGSVAAAAMNHECRDIANTYVAAAQADNGPAAAAALEALDKAGGCGLLAQVQQPAAPTAPDPRFVSRGDTPMLDRTAAACDQQPETCAAVVGQLRAGTSSQAVSALYSNAIAIGLEIGVMMGTAVLNAQQMNLLAARRPNMGSLSQGPVRSGGSPPSPAPTTVHRPRPPTPGCAVGGPGWCTAQ